MSRSLGEILKQARDIGGYTLVPSKIAHILAPISNADLTKEEVEQLLEYLQFLRFRKRRTPNPSN